MNPNRVSPSVDLSLSSGANTFRAFVQDLGLSKGEPGFRRRLNQRIVCVERDLIVEILYGPARRLTGSPLDDANIVSLACEELMEQTICIVRHWIILDVLLSSDDEQMIRAQGLRPSILYAHCSVFDSEGRIPSGAGVITGYCTKENGCFFETPDTLFILAGVGARKFVSFPAVQALRNPQMRQALGVMAYD